MVAACYDGDDERYGVFAPAPQIGLRAGRKDFNRVKVFSGTSLRHILGKAAFAALLGSVLYTAPAYAVCSNNMAGVAGRAGEIEYFTTTNRLMYCDDTNWIEMRAPNPVENSVGGGGPTGCPNVGDICSDGSKYVGLSPDGNLPMYTTAADSGGIPWNNGNNTGYVNLYTPVTQSLVGGAASTEAFLGVDSNSAVGGVQPFQAPEHCANSTAHGQTDWYVPSRSEFLVMQPNRAVIGGFSGGTAYWTSSEVCCNAMWYVSITDGSFGAGTKNFSNNVRCVRKGVTALGPVGCPNIGNVCPNGSVFAGMSPDGNVQMFTTPADAPQTTWNNGSGTSIDTALVNCNTGAQSSCSTGAANTTLLAGLSNAHAPYRAAQYCENLVAHGANDWFLPAANEFEVLANNYSAIGGFTSGGTVYYLDSSSEINGTQIISWTVNPYNGYVNNKSATSRMRCVRKGSLPGLTEACTQTGRYYYDAANQAFRYCNGNSVVNSGPLNLGGAGTCNTSVPVGTLDYFTSQNTFYFCNGSFMSPIGRSCTNCGGAANRKVAFVTSKPIDGNMGGITGANALCQAEANSAGLTGTYAAWLADSTAASAPATRFSAAIRGGAFSIVRPDGVIVADNWADLIDGTLDNFLNYSAFSARLNSNADSRLHTNVATNGTRFSGTNHCTNFTATTGNVRRGQPNFTNSTWTSNVDSACSATGHLYCFEQ